MAAKNIKRVGIYARVSTDQQTSENQLIALREYVARMGWETVGEFVDAGISGTKGREKRPAFDRVMKAAAQRQIDVVLCWRLDRLSRSLRDLLNAAVELEEKGVDLVVYDQNIDTTTSQGKLFFHMIGAFAEFERGIIVDRVKAGLTRAKENGTKSGKPIGRPKVANRIVSDVRRLRRQRPSMGMIAIAKEVGCGVGTVQRILSEE